MYANSSSKGIVSGKILFAIFGSESKKKKLIREMNVKESYEDYDFVCSSSQNLNLQQTVFDLPKYHGKTHWNV